MYTTKNRDLLYPHQKCLYQRSNLEDLQAFITRYKILFLGKLNVFRNCPNPPNFGTVEKGKEWRNNKISGSHGNCCSTARNQPEEHRIPLKSAFWHQSAVDRNQSVLSHTSEAGPSGSWLRSLRGDW